MAESYKTKIVTASPNVSFVLSQASDVLWRHISPKFASGFFKSRVFLTEDFAARRARDLAEGRNKTAAQEIIRPNPAISFRPTYSVDPTDTVEPHDNWMHIAKREGLIRELRGVYPHIYSDIENDRWVFALPKRKKMTIDVKIRVDSELMAWDTLDVLKNMFITGEPFYLNDIPMQAVVPWRIIRVLALECGYDLTDATARSEFTTVLRRGSYSRFSRVVDPAKGQDFYTFYFEPNFLMKFSTPTMDGVEKSGKSTKHSIVGFTAELEFSSPTNFAIEVGDDLPDEEGNVYNETSRHVEFSSYTIPPVLELESGRKIIFFQGFMTDPPDTEDLTVPVYGPEKGPGATVEPYVDSAPDGWSVVLNTGSTAEEDAVTLHDTVSTWAITDGGAGFTLVSDDVDFEGRRASHRVVIVASCNTHNHILVLSDGMRRVAKLTFDQPNVFQTFTIDFEAQGPMGSIVLEPDTPVDGAIVNVASASIKMVTGTVETTSTEDFVHLSGVLDPKVDAVIQYNLDQGIDNDAFFEILVLQGSVGAVDDADLSMDWENRVLTVSNPRFNWTHYVGLYAYLDQFRDTYDLADAEE